ncbi:MAG: LrgB family protein [Verrucomicrobia bacterium]|nr:LrgB family protein [Verrucomicrobiota bacterium]
MPAGDPGTGWEQIRATPLFAITLTLASYQAGICCQRLCRGAAMVNPVLTSILLIGAFLHVTGTSYETYFSGAQLIHFMLGPATVALAIPIVHNLERLKGMRVAILLGILAGSVVSAVSGVELVELFGGSRAVAMSMAPKAATTPIAIGVSQTLGGIPSLSAVLAIASGILAAVSLEFLLGLVKISDWRPLGLAAGTAGSGIGAARAVSLHETAGAFAGLAVALNGVTTALLVPLLVHFWPK